MAIPPVTIDFVVRNTADVSRAFRSVSDAISRSDRTSVATARAAASQRNRIVDDEARNRGISAKRGEAEFGAALRASMRASDQAARADVRAAQTAATEKLRIAQRLAAEERRLRAEVLRESTARGGAAATGPSSANRRLELIRSAKDAAPHEQRAAIEQSANMRLQANALRAGGREAEAAAKVEERAAQRTANAKKRINTETEREASKQRDQGLRNHEKIQRAYTRATWTWTRERQRAKEEEEKVSERKRQKFASSVVGGTTNAARSLVSGGVGLARTALQLGGGFSVQDTLQDRLSLERQATLLSNKDPSGGHIGSDYILGKTRKASIATGTDEKQLLGAWESYADKTGDFKGGEKNMEFFGKLSKATGADIGQISNTAGLLRVQNKNLGETEMKQMLLNVVAQGRSGAVDFGELAGHASAITKSSSAFAGDQTDTQRRLLALSQIGVRTGSVGEAATMISNISQDAGKHSDAITGLLGTSAFNEKGQIASTPEAFLADIVAKTGGNRQKIQDLGFGARSIKLFDAILPTYNDAEKKALANGGSKKSATEAGKSAVLADMGQFTNAKYDEKDLAKDFAAVMSSSAEQFEGAVRTLKATVADQLVPALLPLIGIIKDATPAVGRMLTAFVGMAQWAQRNPLAAAVAGMGAMVAKDVAAAAIGKTIETALATKIGSSGGMVIGTGVIAITSAMLAIEKMASDDDAQVNRGVKAESDAANAQGLLRSADEAMAKAKTPEEKAAAAKLQAEALAKANEAKGELDTSVKETTANKGGNSWFKGAGYLGGIIADTATFGLAGGVNRVKEANADRVQTDTKAISEQTAQMKKLTDVMERSVKATLSSPAGAPVTNPGSPARNSPISSPGRSGGS